ncbi:MAG: 2-C-methyl-D-erythritol 4-phosphate cytidylyltransferase [Alysiella sp.]|uniref:2-C-methyl-D-erythritol 4-phosphate cytidylyltransferase n=1 Tax=Alysiella sp. TaxID=1872483 RepID=UPI0026DB842D|nr:2-C-methyl-D-erythritol 4-phosphate cytidylyltransferase [Alysiella sp.]MDO4433709.1 2-C-methyl-D-erythritol 4-phosphate cytidylyltransferase [Alysiella sp.]
MKKRNIVLIPAAGVGSRFGADKPKQYIEIAGKTVLQHTLDLFATCTRIQYIAIIISPEDTHFDVLIRLPENAAVYRVGGASRAETVANGLNALLNCGLANEQDRILVHDAARCCLPETALNRLLDAADYPDGALLALPVADTLKRQNSDGCCVETVSRTGLWQAQTPQLFQAALLQRALQVADKNNVTDEASAIETLGLQPLLVEGDSRNLKLTRPDDALMIASLLSHCQNQVI